MEFLRRRLGLIFRAVVSLLAIWWVVRSNNWAKVWDHARSMDFTWLLIGGVCFLPTVLVVSWRWRTLLRVHDVHMRFWRVFELNMIGQFFSTVGVGTTGGDVFKIFYVARAVPEQKTAVAFTVIVDRVIGLIALLLFGVVLSFTKLDLLLSNANTKPLTMTFYAFAAAGAVGAIGASLSPIFLRHRHIVALIDRLPFAHRSRKLVAAFERTARAFGTNLVAMLVSIPSHMSITLMGYCVLRAMDLHPDLIAFCSIIAIVNMLIALPVSISGIGVREQLFTWFFALLGIAGDQAVTFSLTYFALNILWSLAGGPFYFLYRHETHTPPPNVAEVEPIFFRTMNPQARDIVARLQQAGFTAYLAGGCVRDQLLGIEAKDFDVATSARPEEVQRLFPRVTNLTGKSFGVVRVLVDEEQFEVAMFRQDGAYVDGRHPQSVTPATPEVDAQRRDFTINGLFYDPVAEKLIDFVGGEADLRGKILRAIGNPADRFAEDQLRLLRAIRFAARLNFKIEPKTMEAIQAMAASIRTISAERIRDEINKIFTARKPERGLDLLDQSGLLPHVLPDIAAMHGVEQPPNFHPEGDVYEHVRLMLTKINEPNLDLALGILFHDVAKKITSKTDENGRIRFNEHESVGAVMTEKIMTDMRYDNKSIETVKELVQHHMQFKDVPKMKPSTLKRMMSRPTFQLELELHRIDCASSHGDLSHYDYLKHQLDTMPPDQIDPPRLISGKDLLAMGLRPGKEVGRILEAVRLAQLEETVQNRIEALDMAKKLASRGMETHQLPRLPELEPKNPIKPPE